MKTRSTKTAFVLLVVFLGSAFPVDAITLTVAVEHGVQSASEPRRQSPSKERKGFAEFALERINPNDINYGVKIDSYRQVLIYATFKETYFWTAVASVFLLLFTFVLLLVENNKRKRHELIAARFLTCYHNELLAARATASEAVKRHDRLKYIVDGAASPVSAGASNATGRAQPSSTNRAAQTLPSAAANHELVTELNMLRQERPILQGTITKLRKELNERKQKTQTTKVQ